MIMGNNSSKRYRISVPLDDVSVIEWMSCQHSLSMSLRQLVKAAIEVNGMRDYFASDSGEVVRKPRRGRPPKVLTETYEDEEVFAEPVHEAHVTVSEPVRMNPVRTDSVDSDASDRIRRMQGLLNK
jgi:hypothetical protein